MRLSLAIAALFLTLSSAAARAQGVILMANMNYSSEELKALEKVARDRGQRVEMVPPRELIPLAEPLFLKRYQTQAELLKQLTPQGEAPSEKLKGRIKRAMAGIARAGAEWRGDPEILARIPPARVQELHAMAQRLYEAEKKHGDIYEQLKKKAAELKARGHVIDTVAFSSHADGANLTGESTLRLSANEITHLQKEAPSIFESPRHVLLLGCYNMTRPNHRAWRHPLFPGATMLAGFGIKAPSRFDQKSSNFILETLGLADRLDRKMAEERKALDPRLVDSGFNALKSFTTAKHPGVADYCYQIVEGVPGTYARDCDTQWKELYAKKAKMEGYWSLVRPSEDPPVDSGGDLRIFYNNLQAACPAKETASVRDSWQAAERMRTTLLEHTARLMFWWNVQGNFATYHKADIELMNHRLAAAGVEERMPTLDGSVGRVRFVAKYNMIMDELNAKNPSLRRDFVRLYGPLFYLKGESTVAQGEKLSVEHTLARNAIPFNWIDGSTVMRKKQ